MPAITLSFVNVPAAGQAQKDVPVNVPTSEAFYSFTREFLPWGAVNNGMAALPYRVLEDMIAGLHVQRVMKGALEGEGTLSTAFDLVFLGKVIGRLIELGLFEDWSTLGWLDLKSKIWGRLSKFLLSPIELR